MFNTTNCTHAPASTPSDAGVAGAGVSFLLTQCVVQEILTSFSRGAPRLHYHSRHRPHPLSLYHLKRVPSESPEDSPSHLPQTAQLLQRPANRRRHRHPSCWPFEDRLHRPVPFLHHLDAIFALRGDSLSNSVDTGARLQEGLGS